MFSSRFRTHCIQQKTADALTAVVASNTLVVAVTFQGRARGSKIRNRTDMLAKRVNITRPTAL